MLLFAAGSKVLSNFLEGPAEALGRRQRTKAQHRIVSLFNSPVISLNSTIHVALHRCFTFGPSVSRIARG